MPQNILITPTSGEPQIQFTGSGIGATPINLNVLHNSTISFEGTQGQLFSITDSLQSGVIFSVNDIAGLPLIEANASGDVYLVEYGRYVGVGTSSPSYILDVDGSMRCVGSGFFTSFVEIGGTNSDVLRFKSTTSPNNRWAISTDSNGLFHIVKYGNNWAPEGTGLTINRSNYIGIGTANPTAYLHIKNGTTAANTAPLKFTPGSLLTVPESGALEFSSSTLWFTPLAERRSIDLSDGVIVASTTVANTITETTIYTEPIAANELHAGQVVKVRALGRYSTANGADTATIRLKVGGTTILSVSSTAANVTNAPLDIEFIFTVRSDGVSGTIIGFGRVELDNQGKSVASTSTSVVDTTIAEDVTITVQWSSADPSNTLSIDQGFTQFID